MSDKFRNKDNTLTRYALACGYIETHNVPGGRFEVRLSLDGEYMVKVSDARLDLGLAAWENYVTLGEARKAVRDAIRYYKGQNDAPALERSTDPWHTAPWEG